MRKSLPALLITLGAFFLVLALLTRFYAGSSLQRTPLDTDSTTRLTGTASLSGEPEFPVKATSITRADSKKSDGDVIVFENSSCLVKDEGDPPNCVAADDPQERLITASTASSPPTGTRPWRSRTASLSAGAGPHKG